MNNPFILNAPLHQEHKKINLSRFTDVLEETVLVGADNKHYVGTSYSVAYIEDLEDNLFYLEIEEFKNYTADSFYVVRLLGVETFCASTLEMEILVNRFLYSSPESFLLAKFLGIIQ